MHGFANVLVQLYSDPPPSNVDVRGAALGNALLIKCFLSRTYIFVQSVCCIRIVGVALFNLEVHLGFMSLITKEYFGVSSITTMQDFPLVPSFLFKPGPIH